MFEIKMPEHALGNFFAQKTAAEAYRQYAEILGEEKAQEIFTRTWQDLNEVDRLESLGLYDEAAELEDDLDDYIDSVMEEMDALQDSDYGENWD